jgi:hypothetical protein
MRYAARSDTSQPKIVQALRDAGYYVYNIRWPADLLVWREDIGFRILECKTPRGKRDPKAVIDKRQVEQNAFLALTGAPRVLTPEQALAAVQL